MSLTIDKTATFTCDACGETVQISIGNGRPQGWAKLDFKEDGRQPISHDFCDDCAPDARNFMILQTKHPPS